MTDGPAKQQTVRAFLWDVLKRLLSPDSRALRTFAVLLRHPGELTRAYFDDVADDFIHPLEVFILANVFFFVVGGITHNRMLTTPLNTQLCCQMYSVHARNLFNGDVNRWRAASWKDATRDARTDISRAEDGTERLQSPAQRAVDYLRYRVTLATIVARFETRFNDASDNDARSLVILFVPMLVAVLAVLQFRRGTGVQHIVFSLHFYAFALILYSVMWAVVVFVTSVVHYQPSDPMMGVIEGGMQTVYLILAMGAAYGDGRIGRVTKGLIAGVATVLFIPVYRLLLFLFVFYAVR